MMIIGAINVSKDGQYACLRGRISLFWSRSQLKQGVRQGGMKHRLAEIHQLLSDVCHLLFLHSNLSINLRVKHLPKPCD
ncbi:hypothetical protein MPH_14163, partial [Macrophomina phaseolina MS6]